MNVTFTALSVLAGVAAIGAVYEIEDRHDVASGELRALERQIENAERDFPAFHTGMYKSRPGYRTGARGLYLAGDWVKLPIPAMLMEAAFTSGTMCANAILRELGLPEAPLHTVPREGILTGVPSLPDFSADKRPAA